MPSPCGRTLHVAINVSDLTQALRIAVWLDTGVRHFPVTCMRLDWSLSASARPTIPVVLFRFYLYNVGHIPKHYRLLNDYILAKF